VLLPYPDIQNPLLSARPPNRRKTCSAFEIFIAILVIVLIFILVFAEIIVFVVICFVLVPDHPNQKLSQTVDMPPFFKTLCVT